MKFVTMKSKSTGKIILYPEHYLNHPVFGNDLEIFDAEAVVKREVEIDKVVDDNHELPVDQRGTLTVKQETKTKEGDK